LWVGKYSVQRGPFGALDVNLQNVDRRLSKDEKTPLTG